MKRTDMGIGTKIRLIREKEEIKQKTLAETVGINANVLSYYETEKHEPPYYMVECLLEALGYQLRIERKDR